MPVALEMVEFEEVLGFENMTSDGTGTFACPAGGSVTAQFDVDQPPIGEVSTGDRFSVSFSSCMLDSSSRLNGSLVYDFNVIVGNYLVDDTWEVDIDLAPGESRTIRHAFAIEESR